MKIKIDKIKEEKRASRKVIGKPSRGRKVGPHKDQNKEKNKNKCREEVDDTEWSHDGWPLKKE